MVERYDGFLTGCNVLLKVEKRCGAQADACTSEHQGAQVQGLWAREHSSPASAVVAPPQAWAGSAEEVRPRRPPETAG